MSIRILVLDPKTAKDCGLAVGITLLKLRCQNLLITSICIPL